MIGMPTRREFLRNSSAAWIALFVLGVFSTSLSSYGERHVPTIDQRVAALIEKMVNSTTEQQAFSDLEALGCPAVPAIIERMDDRRNLPDRRISLRNKSPEAFEATRQYGPQQVVDALAAILNQITGKDFGFIYNGATDAERVRTVRAWRDFLNTTPSTKLCTHG
jgi:hypothetical protein